MSETVIKRFHKRMTDDGLEQHMRFASVRDQVAAALEPLSGAQRNRVLKKVFAELDGPTADQLHVSGEKTLEVLNWLEPWEDSLRLKRCEASRAHVLATAIEDGSICTISDKGHGMRAYPVTLKEKPTIGQVFVVEHDWAAAFANAEGYTGGAVSLPFDRCCFEFNLNGRHVCLLARNGGNDIFADVTAFVLIGTGSLKDWWLHLFGGNTMWKDILTILVKQVDAICVSLEAKVAETAVVRAPYKLNVKRERDGKLPIFDYHQVNLARRHRASRLHADHVPGERRRPRLHFRRKHWRHLENHKVEIPWTLVGDPDLGFIDKEYRL